MNYKTSDVAKKLNVSSNMISKIAKELHMNKDEQGFYIFTEKDITKINIYISKKNIEKSPTFDNQLQQLLKRIKENEYTISQKADNVVTFQLLQHRQELEEFRKEIGNLNQKIDILKEQLLQFNAVAATSSPPPKINSLWKKILGIS